MVHKKNLVFHVMISNLSSLGQSLVIYLLDYLFYLKKTFLVIFSVQTSKTADRNRDKEHPTEPKRGSYTSAIFDFSIFLFCRKILTKYTVLYPLLMVGYKKHRVKKNVQRNLWSKMRLCELSVYFF